MLRIREGGLLYGACPCSLMVWIAKFVHKRTIERPWGDEQWSCAWPNKLLMLRPRVCCVSCRGCLANSGVQESNLLCSRFCMALYLGTVRHVYSAIEQPVSSMLRWIPHFIHLRRLLDRCSTPNAEWEHSSLPCPELHLCRFVVEQVQSIPSQPMHMN